MKQLLVSFLLLTLTATPVFADTVIQQGSAQDTIHVSTNVQGSGSVTTHIQSTVNGQTKTFDSNTPGSYTIQNSAPATNGSSGSSTVTPTISPTTSPTASPTAIPTIHSTTQQSILVKIQQTIHNFFQKLLSLFHL